MAEPGRRWADPGLAAGLVGLAKIRKTTISGYSRRHQPWRQHTFRAKMERGIRFDVAPDLEALAERVVKCLISISKAVLSQPYLKCAHANSLTE